MPEGEVEQAKPEGLSSDCGWSRVWQGFLSKGGHFEMGRFVRFPWAEKEQITLGCGERGTHEKRSESVW